MRIAALLIIICGLATPAFAQQHKDRTIGSIGSATQGSNMSISIPKPKTGLISLCQTGNVLDISVSNKRLVVKGGRQCSPDEASVIIDPTTNRIVGGTNNGVVIINVSSQ